MRRIVAGAPEGEQPRVLSAQKVGSPDGPRIFRGGGGRPMVPLSAIPEELSSIDAVIVHLWESLGPDKERVGIDTAGEAEDYAWLPGPEGLFWRSTSGGPDSRRAPTRPRRST